MGRKPVDENEKIVRFTIGLPKWVTEKLKEKKNYNKDLQKLITKYVKDNM